MCHHPLCRQYIHESQSECLAHRGRRSSRLQHRSVCCRRSHKEGCCMTHGLSNRAGPRQQSRQQLHLLATYLESPLPVCRLLVCQPILRPTGHLIEKWLLKIKSRCPDRLRCCQLARRCWKCPLNTQSPRAWRVRRVRIRLTPECPRRRFRLRPATFVRPPWSGVQSSRSGQRQEIAVAWTLDRPVNRNRGCYLASRKIGSVLRRPVWMRKCCPRHSGVQRLLPAVQLCVQEVSRSVPRYHFAQAHVSRTALYLPLG